MKKFKKHLVPVTLALLLCALCCVPAFAAESAGAGAGVAEAVEQTWKDTATQIKTVMNNVVFPALDLVLAIAFFCKLAIAYFDYRQRNHFEWVGPVALFACLVFTLTAPLYIWTIVGL